MFGRQFSTHGQLRCEHCSSQRRGQAWCRPCAAQLVEEVGDKGNRVAILLGDFVYVPNIHAKSEGAIFFLGKEDGGTGW